MPQNVLRHLFFAPVLSRSTLQSDLRGVVDKDGGSSGGCLARFPRQGSDALKVVAAQGLLVEDGIRQYHRRGTRLKIGPQLGCDSYGWEEGKRAEKMWGNVRLITIALDTYAALVAEVLVFFGLLMIISVIEIKNQKKKTKTRGEGRHRLYVEKGGG